MICFTSTTPTFNCTVRTQIYSRTHNVHTYARTHAEGGKGKKRKAEGGEGAAVKKGKKKAAAEGGEKAKKKPRKKKDPNAPKRALTAFIYFSNVRVCVGVCV